MYENVGAGSHSLVPRAFRYITSTNKIDNVKELEKEIEILSTYLPKEMSYEEIVKVVDEVITEVKPESIKEMGKVMKRLNEELASKNADMSLVSSLVKEKLS